MFPRFGSIHHHLTVQIIGDANIDHINFFIFEHFAVIGISPGNPLFFCKFFCIVRAGDRHNFSIMHPTFESKRDEYHQQIRSHHTNFYFFVHLLLHTIIEFLQHAG